PTWPAPGPPCSRWPVPRLGPRSRSRRRPPSSPSASSIARCITRWMRWPASPSRSSRSPWPLGSHPASGLLEIVAFQKRHAVVVLNRHREPVRGLLLQVLLFFDGRDRNRRDRQRPADYSAAIGQHPVDPIIGDPDQRDSAVGRDRPPFLQRIRRRALPNAPAI